MCIRDRIGGNRLFAEDVFPRLETVLEDLQMSFGVGGDQDDIHVIPVEIFLIIGAV